MQYICFVFAQLHKQGGKQTASPDGAWRRGLPIWGKDAVLEQWAHSSNLLEFMVLKLAEDHQHHWRWRFRINCYKVGGKFSPYFSLVLCSYFTALEHLATLCD